MKMLQGYGKKRAAENVPTPGTKDQGQLQKVEFKTTTFSPLKAQSHTLI